MVSSRLSAYRSSSETTDTSHAQNPVDEQPETQRKTLVEAIRNPFTIGRSATLKVPSQAARAVCTAHGQPFGSDPKFDAS